MDKIKIDSVYFKKLKGLNDVTIEFSDTLTAIMGVNGSGKTTVIHALTCSFTPNDNSLNNYKFPNFFIPNTDSLWNGSEFRLYYRINDNCSMKIFSKTKDRWSPQYSRRPKRDIHYIGIDSCLPEIEKTSSISVIQYKSAELTEKIDIKVKEYAAYILNKSYQTLLDNEYKGKHLMGVQLSTGIKYSSLSMGTGEQRVIKILKTVLSASPYSLILIDEIDLLLHVSALRRFIEKLSEISKNKKIQIVFTTHSLEILNLDKYVKVQYIANSADDKTYVYDRINSDLIYDLTGSHDQPYKIYVEDTMAKVIVEKIIKQKNVSIDVNVVTFGAIENAFTLAACWVLEKEDIEKKLIVLDGDRYNETAEKLEQIKKKLSGTEMEIEDMRNKAVGCIKQFTLPTDYSPEKYLHELIIENCSHESEIYKAAIEIKAVKDSHEWIYSILQKLDYTEKELVNEIFNYIKDCEKFKEYCKIVYDWIDNVVINQ